MGVRRRKSVVVLLVGLLGVLSGCGSGSESPPMEQAASSLPGAPSASKVGAPDCPPPELVVSEGVMECEFPDVVFDPDADPSDRVAGLVVVARSEGYDEIASALADGELTVAERRQAFQDALDCMTSQGMGVAQFEEYDGLYGTEFTFVATWGSLNEADASRVSTECEDRYTSIPKKAYEILTGGRFTERARAVLQACLERHGGSGDVGETIDEFREVVPSSEAETNCLAEAEDRPPLPADLPQPPGG
ncbi:MAG: hypothetical protein GX643_16525 [Acidimicrobiales bacterium]|nr:hypothetical protein [Acidimicrobiales bacterium]